MIGYLTQNFALIHALQRTTVRRSRGEISARQRMFQTAIKLSDCLLPGELIASKGGLDCPISGLAMDSRRVVPGNLFFALRGRRTDGARSSTRRSAGGRTRSWRGPAHLSAGQGHVHPQWPIPGRRWRGWPAVITAFRTAT